MDAVNQLLILNGLLPYLDCVHDVDCLYPSPLRVLGFHHGHPLRYHVEQA